MKSIRRHLRISPKKVNLVADLVRGKNVEEAISFLRFTPKKSAKPLMEAIKSALANAEQNFRQHKKDLFVDQIIVNDGTRLKRSRPVSRGRSHPILKKLSHITVHLAVKSEEAAKPEKTEKAKVETPTAAV
ncbi:50S ribosomal protein L22 [Candidatus Peregrinibacteria bacterium]|nr:50S ribosomal protein L22 [Candidatus Peregrinibacteria bacterium]